MAHQPESDQVVPPSKSVLTGWELVTWIAFGRAIPEERLDAEVAADERAAKQVDEAKCQLRDRVAGRKLVAHYRQRGKAALAEPLDANLFMGNPAITLTDWYPVHKNAFRQAKEWWDKKQPRFEDMLFETAQVLALWPGPLGAAHTLQAAVVADVAAPTATMAPPLRPAPDKDIRGMVREVYRHAQKHGMKPPNLREVARPVQEILKREGQSASAQSVERIAGEPDFATCRRKPGNRVNGRFPAFSLEGWKKSGVES